MIVTYLYVFFVRIIFVCACIVIIAACVDVYKVFMLRNIDR